MRDHRPTGLLRHGDGGQTIILAPLFLFLFMIGGVLIVDLGRVYVARRSAQAAVDFAALAAAQELPRSDLEANKNQMLSDARFQANTYLRLNDHDPAATDVTARITTSFDGDIRKIEVMVERDHKWMFAGFFGIPDPTVSARAVAEANATPRDVVVVLDRSGSMCLDSHGGPMLVCPDLDPGETWEPFDTMRAASLDFTTAFTPDIDGLPFDYLSVVSYSSEATLDAGLTTDYGVAGSAFNNAVDSIVPSGRTNIGHGLYVALQEIENNGHAGTIQAIVLLTDGDTNTFNSGTAGNPNFERESSCGGLCRQSWDYALDQARLAAQQGIAIYTIGLTERAGKDLLVQIAQIGQNEGGGGAFYDVADPDQLTETFLEIAALIQLSLVE